MNKQWWKESVVYQIYPRSFYDSNGDGIGDLPGVIEKLDYLHKLGVDVIWLSPVYQSPNDDNGYDISDYYNIMEEFGTLQDWEVLIEEMHKRNMKLVMDLVVNHTSDEHEWFVEARKSKDNPYRDYYIWRPPFEGKTLEGKEPTDWKSYFSGPTWEFDQPSGDYYLHLYSKKQPDLNWENENMRQEIYEMMKFWLDKGVDGFRMDVINMISKIECLPSYEAYEKGEANFAPFRPNADHVHDHLKEMYEEVLSKYDIMTVGECPSVTTEQAKLYTGEDRKELNMIFQFEHMGIDKEKGKSKWDLKKFTLLDLKENLTKWQKALENDGWNSLYWNNHDQPRVVSRFGNDTTYRKPSAKMLATLLHMMKGTPYIYQGEEIGMTNVAFETIDEYEDIETVNMYQERVHEQGYDPKEVMKAIYARGRDNARTPVQWNNNEHGGFTTGTPWLKVNPNYQEINVEEALDDPDSIFYYYQKLIQLRKQHDIIVYGNYDLILEDDEQIFAYTRTLKDEKLLVINNFYENVADFSLPEELKKYEKEFLIGNYENSDREDISSMKLRPYEALVYKLTV